MRRLQVLDEWIRLGDRLEQPLVLLASLTHSADERLRAATKLTIRIWRGVASRRAYARIKAGLLLDETVASEAMSILVSARRAAMTPPASS